jgi:hypothetical protein
LVELSYAKRVERGKGPFTLGKYYPTNISKPGILPGGSFGYTYDEIRAVEVLNITSPKGKEYVHPAESQYDHRLKEWLRKETNFLDQLSQVVGQDAPAYATSSGGSKTKPRDLNGTGTCPCCFRNIKLKKSGDVYKMVLHGYERPGWGRAEGECLGVGHQPYELSSEGTKVVVKFLQSQVERKEAYLKDLKDNKFESIVLDRKMISKGDPDWTKSYIEVLRRTESDLDRLEKDLGLFKKLVSDWKLTDLPEEGDKIAPPPLFLTR